ncbi:hypothetical protein CMI47_06445 [Candidatus Pacearchaeota archaeon]|nr:hypothetical protein [Candidatus Pacearchaeota archaeon]|tara:strand:+ start:5194 stop:8334 length:3141 start_codon:yes stop_codon:yes gene_type:complete
MAETILVYSQLVVDEHYVWRGAPEDKGSHYTVHMQTVVSLPDQKSEEKVTVWVKQDVSQADYDELLAQIKTGYLSDAAKSREVIAALSQYTDKGEVEIDDTIDIDFNKDTVEHAAEEALTGLADAALAADLKEAADRAHARREKQRAADKKKSDAAQAAAKAAQDKKDEELKKELGETRIAYREQCVLMSQIIRLSTYKNAMETAAAWSKPAPYPAGAGYNASLQIQGEPYGFINKLTQYPNYKRFFGMTSAEISNMVPMIRLFKISQDSDGEQREVELAFQTHAAGSISESDTTSIQNFIKDKNKRGFGVGVKDFTFSYVGTTPFAAKKSIEAKLTLFANGFDELLMCRGLGKCDSNSFEDRAGSYRYADLALKTGGKNLSSAQLKIEDAEKNLPKLQFILKAVIGWAIPKNIPSVDESELLEAINNSYITLYLTPTIHEFKIDDQGQVAFTINYLAYVDDFFDQPNFDIFADPKIAAKQILRRLIFKRLSKDCEPSAISELKQSQADAINKEKKDNLKALSVKLVEAQRVRYLTMSQDDMTKFMGKGVFFNPESIQLSNPDGNQTNIDALGAAISETVEEATKEETTESPNETATDSSANESKFSKLMMDPETVVIPYFYISDLIDVVLGGIDQRLSGVGPALTTEWEAMSTGELADLATKVNIEEDDLEVDQRLLAKFERQYKNLRVVLGPLEIVDPRTTQSSFISFGDLPVSLKYFIEWLTDKMLKKEEEEYYLGRFLNEFFNNLVRNFLNDDTCFKLTSSQRVRLQQIVLTSYPTDPDLDEISEEIIAQGGTRVDMSKFPESRMPLLNISGPNAFPLYTQPAGEEKNYLIFFAGRVQPLEFMQGHREDWIDGNGVVQMGDESRGIFHYLNGRDRGLIKKIALSKTSAKYLKEVRFEQDGYDGLQQLREVYDVTVDTFPIVTAFPGTYIFVDPRGFAPNTAQFGTDSAFDLTKYGIGGYHMIWKSDHSFGIGRAESKIYAKWVAEIAYEAEQDDHRSTDGTVTDTPAKCLAVKTAAEGATDASTGTAPTSDEGEPADNVATP